MRVEEALQQVRVLQSQVAGLRDVCCYRSATVAASGLGAFAAALAQSYWIPRPLEQMHRYLILWLGVATASVLTAGAEILVRWLRSDSPLARTRTIATVRQFVPALITGALLTWAMMLYAEQHAELLPALWAIVFSLGIFASSTYLPRGSALLAGYYLLSGLVCLRFGQGSQALAPWTMVISFGVGQLAAAMILYRREDVDDGA